LFQYPFKITLKLIQIRGGFDDKKYDIYIALYTQSIGATIER